MKPLIRKKHGVWQVANLPGFAGVSNPQFRKALQWCIAMNKAR